MLSGYADSALIYACGKYGSHAGYMSRVSNVDI